MQNNDMSACSYELDNSNGDNFFNDVFSYFAVCASLLPVAKFKIVQAIIIPWHTKERP